jgi:hypothetical protein
VTSYHLSLSEISHKGGDSIGNSIENASAPNQVWKCCKGLVLQM